MENGWDRMGLFWFVRGGSIRLLVAFLNCFFLHFARLQLLFRVLLLSFAFLPCFMSIPCSGVWWPHHVLFSYVISFSSMPCLVLWFLVAWFIQRRIVTYMPS